MEVVKALGDSNGGMSSVRPLGGGLKPLDSLIATLEACFFEGATGKEW